MKPNKIFCIGFQKTGTSSLGRALDILGYNVCGYHPFKVYADAEDLTLEIILQECCELAESHDAFKDTPWPIFYQELDQKYPNSKFILVVRETSNWINSVVKDFGQYPNAIHQLIYGVSYPKTNESIWINRYEQHNKEVIDYFKNRSDDFLLLHLDQSESFWEKLCNFLELEIPNQPWPKVNTMRNKKSRLFLNKVSKKIGLNLPK